MNRNRNSSVTAVAALLVASLVGMGSSNCAGTNLAPPAQLSPIGDVAWNARSAVRLIAELQATAIDGEQAGAIKTDDARKIIEATRVAGQGGVDLANALKAGTAATTAKAQAVSVIRSALSSLPKQLSPEAQKVVSPYVTAVLTLLTVFE